MDTFIDEQDVYQQLVLALAPSSEHWRIVLTVLCVQSLLQGFYRLTQTHWQRKSYVAYIFDHAAFAIVEIWRAATTPLLVVSDSLNTNLPLVALSLAESSQSYFFLSVAVILIVLMYFQFRKLPNLK